MPGSRSSFEFRYADGQERFEFDVCNPWSSQLLELSNGATETQFVKTSVSQPVYQNNNTSYDSLASSEMSAYTIGSMRPLTLPMTLQKSLTSLKSGISKSRVRVKIARLKGRVDRRRNGSDESHGAIVGSGAMGQEGEEGRRRLPKTSRFIEHLDDEEVWSEQEKKRTEEEEKASRSFFGFVRGRKAC